MVGPQKQFDIEAALDGALEIFWKQGFEMTSMQDLVDGMGINRASLYDTFGNKTQLYKKALQRYREKSLSGVREQLLNSNAPVTERLVKFLQGMGEAHHQGDKHFGCFLNNTAVELGPHNVEIAESVRSAWDDMEKIFEQLLVEGVNNKELPVKLDTKAVAVTINAMMQGLSVMAKAGTPKNQLGLVVATMLSSMLSARS